MKSKTASEIVETALKGKGLLPGDVSLLLENATPDDWKRVFEVARNLTHKCHQKNISFFAPLYFSNQCINDCVYCGFRASNPLLERKVLTEEEFLSEARVLWAEGHRSLLLVGAEHPVYSGVGQVASYVTALRREQLDFELALEIAPLSYEDYSLFRKVGIKQCLLFQETYDRQIYDQVHAGKKSDYDWRLYAMERALAAGIERIGLGVLLGLGPWKEDLIGLISQAYEIRSKFGKFPATFSLPRLRAAHGALAPDRAREVSDEDFQKILALCRLACPDVGIVLTTREAPEFRKRLIGLGIGVTHMSAGVSTVIGGYSLTTETKEDGQFNLSDHRALSQVVAEVEGYGYQPAFSLATKEMSSSKGAKNE